MKSKSEADSLRIDEELLFRAIAHANDCSLTAHMDEVAIRKYYPIEWKQKGVKNVKRIYNNLRAKKLIGKRKTRPIQYCLTRNGLKLAYKLGFCNMDKGKGSEVSNS